MSAAGGLETEVSGRKRKLDVDEKAERRKAKKLRRSLAEQEKKQEAQNATENGAEPSKKVKKEERKKRKRTHSKKAKAGEEVPLQNVPSSNKSAKKKRSKRRSSFDGPKVRRQSSIDAPKTSRKRQKAAKQSTINPHLPRVRQERIQAWAETSGSESSKAIMKKERRKSLSLEEKKSNSNWTLSPPTAGRYIDHDPAFIQDDGGQDYLISANGREVQLLSLETSLVTRTAAAPLGRSIECFAAGTSDERITRVALDDATVYTWDWQNDEQLEYAFQAPGPVLAMALSPVPEEDRSVLIYLAKGFLNSGIYIEGSNEAFLTTEEQIESVQVLGQLEYVVACSPSVVVIGRRKEGEPGSVDFNWTQISLTSIAMCVDVRLLPAPPPTKKSKSQRPGLSLAIGNTSGEIHLYDDISSISGRVGNQQLPTPRVLHWHREAVSSVKFSQDGNYLISGGKETVLVLWQLQTAKKQFLPHLTAAIERIVVNSKGDRYALQLGDNSIMVLSTSELKPVANFTGLQIASSAIDIPSNASSSTTAALNPRHPNQLLLSVPSTQPRSPADISTRPFLQMFDIQTSRHIARQALTRNNVTDFNLGPERTPIIPPDVNQIALSHDGTWLATIDEWTPPDSDLEHLVSDYADLHSLRQSRREVYLKFWRWDETDGLWTLTTRVDSPHSAETESVQPGKVLALVSDPSISGFATTGEDSSVKIWKPKQRVSHGVAVKDRSDGDLYEWTCKRTIQLPHAEERVDLPFGISESTKSSAASLSYASDGSMLAAYMTSNATENAPVVHFINPLTGESIPKSGLAAHSVVTVGFLDQYFIAVDQLAAYVWDLVNDTVVYKVRTSKKGSEIRTHPRLTIDAVGETFAITTQKGSKKTKVCVYTPKTPQCVYEETFKLPIEAVLAGSGAKGYTLLFSDATIRTLAPATSMPSRMRRTLDSMPADNNGEPTTLAKPATREPEEDMDIDQPRVDTVPRQATEADEEDDRPVVRPEQLAEIFDTPQSYALPPVRDMFEAVIGLFSRKAYVKPAVEAEWAVNSVG